jgi:hypothetical protein
MWSNKEDLSDSVADISVRSLSHFICTTTFYFFNALLSVPLLSLLLTWLNSISSEFSTAGSFMSAVSASLSSLSDDKGSGTHSTIL